MFTAVLIGCGGRGVMHARAYQHIDNAKLVACCDLNAAVAEQRAAELGLRAYSSAEEMIAREKPDLVHVVTQPRARFELLDLVSRMGVSACTVEKPLAVGVEDWRKLCALEKTTRTRIAVCHQFRWYPAFRHCCEILLSGMLGRTLHMDVSAGLNITDQGTHLLDYSFALCGESNVRTVFGTASGSDGFAGNHPGPDTTLGCLTYANGIRVMYNNGFTAPRCGDPSASYQHVRLTAYAEKGRVLWEEFGKWEIQGPGISERGEFEGMDAWTRYNLLAQAGFHKAMYDWIGDAGRAPGNNFRQSLHEWKVVLAMYASALERRPIDVDSFEPPVDLIERLGKALRR